MFGGGEGRPICWPVCSLALIACASEPALPLLGRWLWMLALCSGNKQSGPGVATAWRSRLGQVTMVKVTRAAVAAVTLSMRANHLNAWCHATLPAACCRLVCVPLSSRARCITTPVLRGGGGAHLC